MITSLECLRPTEFLSLLGICLCISLVFYTDEGICLGVVDIGLSSISGRVLEPYFFLLSFNLSTIEIKTGGLSI